MKKKGLFLLKTIFGLGLLVYLVFFVAEPGIIITILFSISLPMAVLAFTLNAVGLMISALRWKLLLDEHDRCFSTSFLLRSYLVGTFFNHFLPTRFGGDLVRVNDTRKIQGGLPAAAAIVATERMSGIIALLVFALFAALNRITFIKNIPAIWIALAVSLAGILTITIFWLFIPAGFFSGRNPSQPLIRKIFLSIDAFHQTIQEFMTKKAVLGKLLAGAFLLQLNVVIHYYFIGQAIGLTAIPFLDYFFNIPILLFVLSIPVSINGIGIRDLTLIQMMVVYGYSPAHAITFSFLDFSFNLLLGIGGGVIYLLRRK